MSYFISSSWFISALYSLGQRFAITFFGLLSFLMLVRLLSVEHMSYWGIFITVVAIFESIKTNLLKNAFIKYIIQAKNENERLILSSSAFLLNLALSGLFVFVILLFSGFIGEFFNCREVLPGLLYWYLPGILFQTIFSHIEFLSQAELNFRRIFFGYFSKQLFFMIAIGLFYLFFPKKTSLQLLSMLQSLSILAGVVIMLVQNLSFQVSFRHISFTRIKDLLGYGRYIFGSGLMATLFANMDQILTASVLSSKSIAYYNAASKINALVDIPSYAAAEIAFPRLTKADKHEGIEKVKYLYEKMVSILMAITLPISLFVILFPGFILNIIAGQEYLPAALILQIYMLTSILRPLQNQAANVLNSIGKESLCFYINMFSLIFNFGINYILIRKFGFYGSAYGTLISFVVGCIVWYFIMRKKVNIDLANVISNIPGSYKLFFDSLVGFYSKVKLK